MKLSKEERRFKSTKYTQYGRNLKSQKSHELTCLIIFLEN